MNGGGHNVAAGKGVFHHIGVAGIGVAAMVEVQVARSLICGQQQPAGAAGVVGDVVIVQRVGVAPVQVFRNGQVRHQRGRFRSGIVSFESFTVGNQSLENGAGHVALPDSVLYGIGSADHSGQHSHGGHRGDLHQQFLGNVEDGPVVDVEDVIPFFNDGPGSKLVADGFAMNLLQAPYALIAGQALMVCQGVDDDGGAHFGGLFAGGVVGLGLLAFLDGLGRLGHWGRPGLAEQLADTVANNGADGGQPD